MQFCSRVLTVAHIRTYTHTGFQYGGYGRFSPGVRDRRSGRGLGWPRLVIPWWLMNGGTDGSFVPVMELATALWEED